MVNDTLIKDIEKKITEYKELESQQWDDLYDKLVAMRGAKDGNYNLIFNDNHYRKPSDLLFDVTIALSLVDSSKTAGILDEETKRFCFCVLRDVYTVKPTQWFYNFSSFVNGYYHDKWRPASPLDKITKKMQLFLK